MPTQKIQQRIFLSLRRVRPVALGALVGVDFSEGELEEADAAHLKVRQRQIVLLDAPQRRRRGLAAVCRRVHPSFAVVNQRAVRGLILFCLFVRGWPAPSGDNSNKQTSAQRILPEHDANANLE